MPRNLNKVAPMAEPKVRPMELDAGRVEFGFGNGALEKVKGNDSTCSSGLSSSTSLQTLEDRPDGLSARATLINFVKGMIGPGCLSLPIAFRQAGLWTGLVLVFAFGFLNNYCMLQLVECSQKLSRKRGKVLDYGGVAYQACAHSFQSLRKYKHTFRMITNTVIVMLQLGICSVFYVFVASHVKELFDDFSNVRLDTTTWSLLVLLPMLLVNLINTLKAIAILSVFGNLCMISSLVVIVQVSELPAITSFDGVLMACGSILYSFEGQAMVLPMENKLRRPHKMIGAFGVLSSGMTLVSVVYALCGFLGYSVYGERTEGSITLNLPNTWLFTLVKGLLVLVIYTGFAIQQYVIVDMLWPSMKRWMGLAQLGRVTDFLAEALFRTLLVCAELTLAVAVPKLEEIIPLVGATAGMLLAFVFPALIDTLTFGPELADNCKQGAGAKWALARRLAQNGFLVLLGLFGLAAGLQTNIRALASQ